MVFVFFLSLTLLLGAVWFLSAFNDLSLYEIIYHLKMPSDGMDTHLVWEFVFKCVIPSAVVSVLLAMILHFIGKKHEIKKWRYRLISGIVCLVFLISSLAVLDNGLGLIAYATQSSSDFIEKHYVDPAAVDMTFPEQKRNLIFIYLESMEITFADKENGGAFDKNVIPHLTDIALENECFSEKGLSGGVSLPATTWTMGGMCAQTAGLPLKIPVYNTYMDTQGSFFNSVTALGDILEENGYTNEIMMGSDSVFGGRRMYFTEHGDYRIFDFFTAYSSGMIHNKVFWGFEDHMLFEFSRKELKKLYEEGKPFNYTMLTVDTHFEDGHKCALCSDDFEDGYSNVYACSDRQIAGFLEWLKKQPFYENTTVILSGDHPTMDTDYCNGIDSNYQRRTYTAVINAPKEYNGKTRFYSTLDMFPTTLSALGVQIEGDRLGLGTDLYSDTPTLLEEYGLEYLAGEFNKNSDFMDGLCDFSINDALAKRMYQENGIVAVDTEEGYLIIYALRFDISAMPDFERLEADVTCNGTTQTVVLDDFEESSLNYKAGKKVFKGADKDDLLIEIYLISKDGRRMIVGSSEYDPFSDMKTPYDDISS